MDAPKLQEAIVAIWTHLHAAHQNDTISAPAVEALRAAMALVEERWDHRDPMYTRAVRLVAGIHNCGILARKPPLHALLLVSTCDNLYKHLEALIENAAQ